MRYVLLLMLLCLSFVGLNSLTKYHSPFSFLSIGNTSPSSSIVYPIRHRYNAHAAAGNASVLKGGPSEGFGLTASAPVQAGAAGETAGTENATDPNTLGDVASAEMGVAGSPTVYNLHNYYTTIVLNKNKIIKPGSIATAASMTSAAIVADRITPNNSITPKGQAVETMTPKGVTAGEPAAGDAGVEDLPAPAPGAKAAVTVGQGESDENEDMDAPVQENAASAGTQTPESFQTLESSLALDADFLDLAPVPDAVAIQPSFSPFALSQQAAAFADSIRNSLMDPHGIQFGGIAGLNWSGASASNTTGKVAGSPLSGFTLGAFADIPLKKKLSFRPEFLYSYEGDQPLIGGVKVNIHVAYLNMPLDLVYHTNLLSKRFFVGAGPYMAYAFNGTYTSQGANTDMQFGNNYASGDNLKNLDFGANFMAGILLDRNFILGATFNLGLSNIAPAGAPSDIHTRSIGLSIGYVFRNKANTKTD